MKEKLTAKTAAPVAAPAVTVSPRAAEEPGPDAKRAPKMSARQVSVFYGEKQALNDVSVDIHDDRVTAFIGPSGCGKSTFLRCLNRMNDTIPSAKVTGCIELDGQDIHAVDLQTRVVLAALVVVGEGR